VTVTCDPDGAADIEPQAVLAPLTGAAIFLVAVVNDDPGAADVVRGVCGDLAGLIRGVSQRDPESYLTCVTGIGDRLWDTLAGGPRPAGLHPFTEIEAGGRRAVSTPGDLLFHIRSARMDLCFELATVLMSRLAGAVRVADEVHGFKYFENRDLIGFVDGTENPAGRAAVKAALIGAEDPAFSCGSYVIVQKYLHDMDGWNKVPVEQQERIIGREKLSDTELTDDVKPSFAHNALTTILDENGDEVQIVRDNMPFGAVGSNEYGTYFIGYSRSPDTTELMLRNMFIGSPEGNYDRLLDFSTAVTGTLFFVPSATMLESLGDGPLDDAQAAGAQADDTPGISGSTDGTDSTDSTDSTGDTAAATGSLEIGSLKGASPDE
jgi:putative iron-dependent peroxidase